MQKASEKQPILLNFQWVSQLYNSVKDLLWVRKEEVKEAIKSA